MKTGSDSTSLPTTPGMFEGRDACVAGWQGFCEAAEIPEWRETDHRVQVYAGGKGAVVMYLFSIMFVMVLATCPDNPTRRDEKQGRPAPDGGRAETET